jgi:methanogenic corrinoid protein MtbC1
VSASEPSGLVEAFLALAVAGETRPAVGLVMGLLDDGIPAQAILTDLLGPAQLEVGARWHRNELSVADEHLATGVADSALHAIAGAHQVPSTTGLVVVACAEGDWHAMAARMFAEQLRLHGVVVAFLGPSTPAEHLAGFLQRHRPEALAISCASPLFYAGVTRLADVAHALGVPVLAGGYGLQGHVERADRLGADACLDDVGDALVQLDAWRADPPRVRADATPLPPDALELERRAEDLADAAYDELERRFPPMVRDHAGQAACAREDLACIVRFVASARLVDDPQVLSSFLDWLTELLEARGVPQEAVTAGLEALHPLINGLSPGCGQLVDHGLAHLAAAP